MAELYIVIADIFPHQILGYCRYLSIYWDMADLGAFGHISADLRLQVWTFELPQSHSFHRNVNIDIIGILHHVLRQHDKSHHAKITQLKSDGSNWVKKGLKRGLKQSRNRYWPISIYWQYTAEVISYHIGRTSGPYLLPIYCFILFIVSTDSSP